MGDEVIFKCCASCGHAAGTITSSGGVLKLDIPENIQIKAVDETKRVLICPKCGAETALTAFELELLVDCSSKGTNI